MRKRVRIAALEKHLGVRLLQRTTRALAPTEAGQRFFERCVATVEGAHAAYDSVAELRGEPAGLVRLSSPVLLTQRCLAHALPGYMTLHPNVSVYIEATDRTVNPENPADLPKFNTVASTDAIFAGGARWNLNILGWARARQVFPPAPPVAIVIRPERRAAVKGVAHFGAAKRTVLPWDSDLVMDWQFEPHPFLHPSFYIIGHSGSSA